MPQSIDHNNDGGLGNTPAIANLFNDYPLIGDSVELYAVINNDSLINLDLGCFTDIMKKDRPNYIITGRGNGERCVGAALREALAALPVDAMALSGIVFHIWYSASPGPLMKDMQDVMDIISSQCSDDVALCWGMGQSDSIGSDIKITLVATEKKLTK